jgi:hypothetical protein
MEIMVRLRSRDALREYMTFYKIKTGYALAKKAGILPGTANFLVQGHRDTCSSRTARAIESALACPPGFLFETSAAGAAPSSHSAAGDRRSRGEGA